MNEHMPCIAWSVFVFAEEKNANLFTRGTYSHQKKLFPPPVDMHCVLNGWGQYKQDADIQWQQGGAVPLNYS